MSVNKVILVGRLGAEPDINFLTSGEAVLNFSVATSTRWTDKKSGERKEDTEWHRVTCFGKLAEGASEHLAKGRQVYIEGRLRTRKWKDKTGHDRYTTEVLAAVIQVVTAGGVPAAPDREH